MFTISCLQSAQTRQRPSTENPGILNPMPTRRRSEPALLADDTLFAVKQRKPVPHEFVPTP